MPEVRIRVELTEPPYRVPSVASIAALPWSLEAVSTFSGGGGSSTGLRLAGIRPLFASEFIDRARETYSANWPDTPVAPEDIRNLKGADILATIGRNRGEIDVLEGSPPCASFSTSGVREVSWGKVKKYSDKAQRTDDLFFEYVRLLDELAPKAFIAENVSGLVKGAAKGYFKIILSMMRATGYVVRARLLDAQWLGVPQARQRIIFLGIRNDLDLVPQFPAPLPYRYTVGDSIADLGIGDVKSDPETGEPLSIRAAAIYGEWLKLRQGEDSKKYFRLRRPSMSKPWPTLLGQGSTAGASGVTHPVYARKPTLAEWRRACGFPDDYKLTGSYGQRCERLGRAVPPPMMAAIASELVHQLVGVAV